MSTIASNGYVLIYVGKEHHLADIRGYAYEHRLVAEKKIGRRLLPGEIVHHVDENKQNNKPENIEVISSIAEHKVHHRKNADRKLPTEINPLILCECGCGESLLKYDTLGRPRHYQHGHSWRKGKGRRSSPETILCNCGCGQALKRFDRHSRERKYIPGHNMRVK